MKILKSKKALSPVVASIILIAVTVAVSIAVAAWMGALSFSFMNNGEQLQLGTPYGWTNGGSSVNVTATCPGSNVVTISTARIGGTVYVPTIYYLNGTQITSNQIPPVTQVVINVAGVSPVWQSGYSYTITIVSSKNNEYTTTGMCP